MYIDRIKTENIKPIIRERMTPYINRLMNLPFIEGVALLGGLSNTANRNFMDKFSDVDMAIFIQGRKRDFSHVNALPDFEFHVPFEERLLEVNVHQQFIDDEYEIDWDEGKKEAYAYTCELLRDRDGKTAKLINEKTKYDDSHRRARLAVILSQYMWLVNINPLRQIERGYYLNAIDLLNTGTDLLIEGIYLFNRRYRPHPKWRIEIAKDLEWLPEDFDAQIESGLLVLSNSEQEILRRRDCLSRMFSELEEKVLDERLFGKMSPYEYACLHVYPDRQISELTMAERHFRDLIPWLDRDEIILLNGISNEYFVTSVEDLLRLGENKLVPLPYQELIATIQRRIIDSGL